MSEKSPDWRVLLAVEQLRRPVPGGIGTYARGLLAGLAVVAPPGTPPEIHLLASKTTKPRRGQPAARDPLDAFGRPLWTSRLSRRLLTRAWDRGIMSAPRGFEVVHSVSTASPPKPPAKGSHVTTALVVVVHDLAWRRNPEATTGRGRRWHEKSLRRAIARADALVVPSDLVAADLVAAGASRSAVTVIPHGADHLAAPNRQAATALLERNGVTGPYLLAVGTIEPRKNLARLVAAYREVAPDLPGRWPLVVVGATGWGSVGQVEGTGVAAVGAVSAPVLTALYQGARAFAYVPLSEGFGLPPLEAMVAGAPVLASTGVPSILDAHGAPPAVVVDPLDTDAIAKGLFEVATDDERRDALVTAGTAFVAGRTWAASAERHVELWQSL